MVSELILNSSNLIELFRQVKQYHNADTERLILMLDISIGFVMINDENKAMKVLTFLDKMLKRNNNELHFSK